MSEENATNFNIIKKFVFWALNKRQTLILCLFFSILECKRGPFYYEKFSKKTLNIRIKSWACNSML